MNAKTLTVALVLGLIFSQSAFAARVQPPIPNPVLYFTGATYYSTGGKNYVRYSYDIFNKDDFPVALFTASPSLPPCGANKNSSRTWVDLFDQTGRRLNGFCALGKPGDLNGIWFAVEADTLPPSWIYIELNDRQTNTKYKSNLAETVM